MEKRNQAVPNEDEIRGALASYTAHPISAEAMWEKISEALEEAEPSPPWLRFQPWLAFGSVAAVLCLILLLNWTGPGPGPGPAPLGDVGPQIMRFSAFAPVSASASVEQGQLMVELTAASDVKFGPDPAVVRILTLDQSEVSTGYTTELAGLELAQGEAHVLPRVVPAPIEPGAYQVHLQLEVETADGSQRIDVFAPFTINGED